MIKGNVKSERQKQFTNQPSSDHAKIRKWAFKWKIFLKRKTVLKINTLLGKRFLKYSICETKFLRLY